MKDENTPDREETPDERVERQKPDLTAKEEKQVEQRAAPRAAVVYETVREEGEFELSRSVSALAWSGLAAGLSMGFSMVSEGLLQNHLPDAPWRPLVSKLGYSIGFLIVILGRQQLFTENTLTVILPLLLRKDAKTLFCVARLWTTVFAANIIGAFIFAFVVAHTDIFSAAMRHTFAEIGSEALRGDWTTIFLRAIFAGWLIALMVWLLPTAESARVWVIIIMTYCVALGGYAHIIAGSIETFFAAFSGAADWAGLFGNWMLPTLLGNIIGGTSLVAVLAHAQIVSENKKEKNEAKGR